MTIFSEVSISNCCKIRIMVSIYAAQLTSNSGIWCDSATFCSSVVSWLTWKSQIQFGVMKYWFSIWVLKFTSITCLVQLDINTLVSSTSLAILECESLACWHSSILVYAKRYRASLKTKPTVMAARLGRIIDWVKSFHGCHISGRQSHIFNVFLLFFFMLLSICRIVMAYTTRPNMWK